jgi:outer membrane beta-barrel protein
MVLRTWSAAFCLVVLTFGLPVRAQQPEQPVDEETAAEGARIAGEDSEEEAEGPRLRDRVKSVQRKVFIKRGRFEFYPQVAFSLNDAFFRNVMLSGSVGYHLSDSLSLEASAGWVAARTESNVVQFLRRETDSLLEDNPELEYKADLNFAWAPIYGKLSLFGEAILHFDTYLTLGGGVFGTNVGTQPAGNVGIGQRYFITDWLVVRLEFRNYFFVEERAGESDLQTPGFIGLSVAGFLPPKFEYRFQ